MIPHTLARIRFPLALALASISPAFAQRASTQKVEAILVRCGSIQVLAMHRSTFERLGIGSKLPLSCPIRAPYRVTSLYGMRLHPIRNRRIFHKGCDLACPAGTLVHATADGVVSFSGWHGDYGNCVIVRHPFGFETLYGHLARTHAHPCQRVRRGTVIGFVGSSGLSTGPHLHYETRKRGRSIQPFIP